MSWLIYIASWIGMCAVLGVGSVFVSYIIAYVVGGKRDNAAGGAAIAGSYLFLLVLCANLILQM